MDKRDKSVVAILVAIMMLLIIDCGFLLYEHIDYERRKAWGNERWEQVEERIKEIEVCCESGRNS